MHASQLAELGAWVAINSNTFIYGSDEQAALVSTRYWQASKVRVDRWVTALKMFEKDFEKDDSNHDPWPALEILIQEILLSELLTRVWSATVLIHDWYHESDELAGLAHSIHISQLEAKNRAIRIMIRGRAHDEAAFDRLNAIRRRVERWCDLFLGQLPVVEEAVKFAFDANRVRDFNLENRESTGNESGMRQKILLSSFTSDLNGQQNVFAANPEANREVAAGVLHCFPADRFDGSGLPKSAKMILLEKTQLDTQALVDQLADYESMADNHSAVEIPARY